MHEGEPPAAHGGSGVSGRQPAAARSHIQTRAALKARDCSRPEDPLEPTRRAGAPSSKIGRVRRLNVFTS